MALGHNIAVRVLVLPILVCLVLWVVFRHKADSTKLGIRLVGWLSASILVGAYVACAVGQSEDVVFLLGAAVPLAVAVCWETVHAVFPSWNCLLCLVPRLVGGWLSASIVFGACCAYAVGQGGQGTLVAFIGAAAVFAGAVCWEVAQAVFPRWRFLLGVVPTAMGFVGAGLVYMGERLQWKHFCSYEGCIGTGFASSFLYAVGNPVATHIVAFLWFLYLFFPTWMLLVAAYFGCRKRPIPAPGAKE